MPAVAQTIVDGGTFKMDGKTWRLWGIDAPEMQQACAGWMAGLQARTTLADLLRGKFINCQSRGADRYGRWLGLCRAGGQDISAGMVRAGMAWAFVRYSRDYVELEQQARAENLGVHAHGCLPTWERRGAQRRETPSAPPVRSQ